MVGGGRETARAESSSHRAAAGETRAGFQMEGRCLAVACRWPAPGRLLSLAARCGLTPPAPPNIPASFLPACLPASLLTGQATWGGVGGG